jgi:hypothetical protein
MPDEAGRVLGLARLRVTPSTRAIALVLSPPRRTPSAAPPVEAGWRLGTDLP